MKRPAILGGGPAFATALPFARPFLPPLDRISSRLDSSYRRGSLTNGALVRELEEAAARRLGVAHVVAVASCTSGLMLVLRALKVARAPVVMPSFTFSATAHAAAWNGARPVFAECDGETFQLDPLDVKARIDGAGALMATHVFGAPCPVEELQRVATEGGVPLVYDAAHAFGARRAGQPVGGFGDAEVFSLSPTKLVVAGEGGLVATDRDDIAEAVRLGRDYANPGDYDTRFVGLNARMSEMHAATALESLALLDEHLRRRRRLAGCYRDVLGEVPGISPQAIHAEDESTFKDFTVIVDEQRFGLGRDALVRALAAEGVDTRCYFSPPVHRQQAYAELATPTMGVTEHVAERVISLPMFADLAPEDVERVGEAMAALHACAGDVRQTLET